MCWWAGGGGEAQGGARRQSARERAAFDGEFCRSVLVRRVADGEGERESGVRAFTAPSAFGAGGVQQRSQALLEAPGRGAAGVRSCFVVGQPESTCRHSSLEEGRLPAWQRYRQRERAESKLCICDGCFLALGDYREPPQPTGQGERWAHNEKQNEMRCTRRQCERGRGARCGRPPRSSEGSRRKHARRRGRGSSSSAPPAGARWAATFCTPGTDVTRCRAAS